MTQIIGHRGWRGKYPENSLEGFRRLFESGVHALELDVVVSKEGELIVSHEAWFDFQYCNAEKKDNLFQLTSEEIKQVDCGSKFDSRFPDQEKIKTVKPTFKELIDLWNELKTKPFIALEVKSEPHLYGNYQPFPEHFAELLIEFEETHLSGFDYFVQSFDPVFLKTYHAKKQKQETGFLIEYETNLDAQLDFLGYQPEYYNPEHVLLTDKLVHRLKDLGIKTTTWTVNTQEDYNRLRDYNLEGVITDYPELFK